MLHYETLKGSLYNTPPCWSIYVCGLVFKHLLNEVIVMLPHQVAAVVADSEYLDSPGEFPRVGWECCVESGSEKTSCDETLIS